MKIQPCDVESLDDFLRYYSRSYVQYRNGAVRILDAREGVVVLSSKEEPEFHLKWDTFKKDASFGVPQLGLRNLGPTIAYFYMSPVRQSNRGYIPANCEVSQFNLWESRKIPKPSADSWEVAQEILNPKFFSVQETIKLLDSGERIGCAVSPNVGVYTTDKSTNPMISYKRTTAGYFEDKEVVLYSKYQRLFYTITKDLGIKTIKERTSEGLEHRRNL